MPFPFTFPFTFDSLGAVSRAPTGKPRVFPYIPRRVKRHSETLIFAFKQLRNEYSIEISADKKVIGVSEVIIDAQKRVRQRGYVNFDGWKLLYQGSGAWGLDADKRVYQSAAIGLDAWKIRSDILQKLQLLDLLRDN